MSAASDSVTKFSDCDTSSTFRPLGFREQNHFPTAIWLNAVNHRGPKPAAAAAAGATGVEGTQGASPAAVAKRRADTGSEATEAE